MMWPKFRSKRRLHKIWSQNTRTALEPGAVAEAVGHDDILVEVVGACGAVTFYLVDHLTDGEDGGGGRGVGLYL